MEHVSKPVPMGFMLSMINLVIPIFVRAVQRNVKPVLKNPLNVSLAILVIFSIKSLNPVTTVQRTADYVMIIKIAWNVI